VRSIATATGRLPPICTVEDPLELARATLGGTPAWLVGGALRDRLLGRPTADLDIVVDGDPGAVARALARAASAPRANAFALSEEFGGWRVVARGGTWQVDVERMRGSSLEEDLALRDFTVNAVAEPLQAPLGTQLIDPLGGLRDLDAGRLRAAGPRAFADDPLRVLRLARIAVELELTPTPQTLREAAAHADRLPTVSPERVFIELRRILAAEESVAGLRLLAETGAERAVLPELAALRGVSQSHYHHRDVYGHTLEVLQRTIELQRDPDAVLGLGDARRGGSRDGRPADADAAEPVAGAAAGSSAVDGAALTALLAEPLADGLTRGEALRWGALLHDIAKPLTRGVMPDAGAPGGERVTFLGHDRRGAELAGGILGRLRTSARLRSHVTALVLHHLRLGFLVHESQPLTRRTVYAYLRATEPVEVDVTLLSVADRLATRGARAETAIEAHLGLARAMLADAVSWRHLGGPPAPLWRGDELARELGIAPGPRLGELLEELARAAYAGEVTTRPAALAHARRALEGFGGR